MILDNVDYFVRFVDMPGSVGGACTPNDDGTFNIYLNANRVPDRERLIEDFFHEFEHIDNDDLYGDKAIMDIER